MPRGIQVVILLDLDDTLRTRTDPPMEAKAPAGYVITELRCVAWGRNTKAGTAELDIRFRVSVPIGS